MKKLFTILLIVVMTCSVYFGYAIVSYAQTTENIYLFAPVSVDYSNSTLYIADNIDEYNSRIHIFNYTSSTNRSTISLNNTLKKIRVVGNTIFTLYSDEDSSLYKHTLIDNKIASSKLISTKCIDFDVNESKFVVATDRIKTYSLDTEAELTNRNGTADKIALLDNDYIYYIKDGNLSYITDKNNDGDITVAVSDSQNLSANGSTYLLYDNLYSDIAINTNEVYTSCISLKSVNKYAFVNNSITGEPIFSIGDSTVDTKLPFNIGDTLTTDILTTIKVTGSPDNIVYTPKEITNDNYKLTGTLLADDEALVLAEPSSQTSNRYLVLFKGKIGFINDSSLVQKVQTILIPETKIETRYASYTNMTVYNIPYVNNTRFKQGGQYIYKDYRKAELTSIKGMKFDIYASFSYDSNKISYVSYEMSGTKHFGYILSGDVKSQTPSPDIKPYTEMKVNPNIGQTTAMYLTNSTTSEILVQLTSGTQVKHYHNTNGFSFIKATIDGKEYSGYVLTSQLVDTLSLTNNDTLVIVCVIAFILIFAYLIIWRIRHKRFKEKEEVTIDIDN